MIELAFKISETGLTLIEKWEGCLTKASNTLDGVWTIVYGEMNNYYGKKPCKGMTTTKAKAHAWLRDHSISKYEGYVNSYVTYSGLTQNMFDALVSFVYDIGGSALKNSTLPKILNAGDVAGAANEFAKWNKCSGKVLAGLTNRRAAEKALFLNS